MGGNLVSQPIIQIDENSSHAEYLIEQTCINAVIDKKLKSDKDFDNEHGCNWRGWNLKYLRRKFNEALAGKDFPKVNYIATRKKVKIVLDKKGKMFWKDLD